MPAIAIAFLVSGSCMALVLNEYWLSGIQEELRSSTQTAALAVARELVTDDLLKLDPPQSPAVLAREKLATLQEMNSGRSSTMPEMELHLGRAILDPSTGQTHKLETDNQPNSVVVIGHRDRSRSNPVNMLIPLLTGRPTADVTCTSEASVTNLIEGFRPFGPVDVPGWPIAILESSSDEKVQTWKSQIELRHGTDFYSWNAETQTVENSSDGIPEILLQPRGDNGTNNCYLVDVGSSLQDPAVNRQFEEGWSVEDLSGFGDVFSFKSGPLDLAASNDFSGVPEDAMQESLGQVRVLMLYSKMSKADQDGIAVEAVEFVAGRLMHVSQGKNGPEFVFQPAVLTTRTAVLDEDALYRGETFGNPYIYKVSITQ
ncbi:hypothetical protein SH668x_003328 [Planctomicrobium sp. SH668]|uniref:hypothetical protein n=1 Tax=Planctomicrobium sp. SH668 TaxID=3448126 RepID=UPI003F5B3984